MLLVANCDDLYVRDVLKQGTDRVYRRALHRPLDFVRFHHLVKLAYMVKYVKRISAEQLFQQSADIASLGETSARRLARELWPGRLLSISRLFGMGAVDPANDGSQSGRPSETGLRQKAYARSDGAMCMPMLSPTRDPEAFTDSFARCAYLAVVWTWV